ncbi:MAG: isoprenylcysteine carboxylmethyltransferase family protein [Acidobacteria bacterium]|nr:isoprenylcysteine carboxylmethyltransferase family protein [Acidobacteriota bacterium]
MKIASDSGVKESSQKGATDPRHTAKLTAPAAAGGRAANSRSATSAPASLATPRWTRILPAAALALLVAWQVADLARALQLLAREPNWTNAAQCARGMNYALFLCLPIAALLTQPSALAREDRRVVKIAAVTATFLLMGLGLLSPQGALLFHPSPVVTLVALWASVAGTVLAIASGWTLGGNFAIHPEVRELVTSGPYRIVRHPIYLAEVMMITGFVIVNARVVTMIGSVLVIGLQVIRIFAEERLYRNVGPDYCAYAARTRFRLLPRVW